MGTWVPVIRWAVSNTRWRALQSDLEQLQEIKVLLCLIDQDGGPDGMVRDVDAKEFTA